MTPEKPLNKTEKSIISKYIPIHGKRIRDTMMHVVLLFVLQLMGCAMANAQTEEEIGEALWNAQNVLPFMNMDSIRHFDQYGFLIPNRDIVVVDKGGLLFDPRAIAMLLPGKYSFSVRYQQIIPTGSTGGNQVRSGNFSFGFSFSPDMVVLSKPIHVEAVFEAGKCYTFEYKKTRQGTFKSDSLTVSVVETDKTDLIEKVEKILKSVKAYKSWWRTHFGALDGTYVTKDGKKQITLAGNKFRISTYQSFTSRTNILEGTFWFDHQTMILCTESVKTMTQNVRSKPGKEQQSTVETTGFIYYKLNNGMLDILAGEGLEGQYAKSSAMPADAVLQNDAGSVTGGLASPDIAWQIENEVLIVSGKGDIPGDPSWAKAVTEFTSAVIGDGITSIGHHAFAMSKITSIVIGKDVTSLKTYALFNCNNLALVEVKSAVPPKVGSFVFMSTPVGKAKLIVPVGSKAAYEKNKDWKKFGTIEEQ